MVHMWEMWSDGQKSESFCCHEVVAVECFDLFAMRYSDVNVVTQGFKCPVALFNLNT